MEVILVDENDNPIGSMEKMKAHQEGVLHRAFSIFVFNSSGLLLLQKRASGKYHSAGMWTNTCCSHPAPGEDTKEAALRRLEEEMGFTTSIEKLFEFTYRAEFDNGLIEYEFDHVFTGLYDGEIIPNHKEVEDYTFLSIEAIQERIESSPSVFSPWFKIAFPKIAEWKNSQNG